uniref:GB1/RHD3-type G domain-containing protein n=1 Tax=Ditylenchus dipsaci TaxID=166011 RepID=A0A915DRG8_9BILA
MAICFFRRQYLSNAGNLLSSGGNSKRTFNLNSYCTEQRSVKASVLRSNEYQVNAPWRRKCLIPIASFHNRASVQNGEPVCIFQTDEDGNPVQLNKDLLEKILLDDMVADKMVVIISIAGAYRKGKSFLLNFFLRYLRCKYSMDKETPSDWLAISDVVDGFSWRGGSERDTTGILIWSQPFIVKDKKGDDVVVLLMDTQGAFDSATTIKECTTIFALSTLLSSVQIFNLSQNLQENDLQYLQTFTTYAKFAQEKEMQESRFRINYLESGSDYKPMQSLWFMIRDWAYPYEYKYGFQGGQQLLEKRLETCDSQHAELRQLREDLKESFQNIGCFLMPYCGEKVASSEHFRGHVSDIKPEFVTNVRLFAEELLNPRNLVVKSINGQPLTCRMLFKYFQEYLVIFRDGKLPPPLSVYQANAMLSNLSAVEHAKTYYLLKMEAFNKEDAPFMEAEKLEEYHEKYRQKALETFQTMPRLGSKQLHQQYLELLEVFMDNQHKHFQEVNNEKKPPASNLTSLAVSSGLWSIVAFVHFPPAAIVAGAIALYPTFKAAQSIANGSMQKEVEGKVKQGWKWLKKKV